MLGGAETDQDQQKELRHAVRRVLASAAMADQDDPAANRTLLNALDSLAGKLKSLPGVEVPFAGSGPFQASGFQS